LGILKEAIVDMFRNVAGLFGAACRERLSGDKALRLLAAMREKGLRRWKKLDPTTHEQSPPDRLYVKHR
jgi:hypothetical protein